MASDIKIEGIDSSKEEKLVNSNTELADPLTILIKTEKEDNFDLEEEEEVETILGNDFQDVINQKDKEFKLQTESYQENQNTAVNVTNGPEINVSSSLAENRLNSTITENNVEKSVIDIKKPVTKPFKCTECKAAFKFLSHLKTHARLHTGERPYNCNICNKRFNEASDLKKHMRVHFGETPFKCDECGKEFARSDYLHNHKRIHSGEKPFKCDVCSKQFSVCSNLKRHKTIHSGIKLYSCFMCQKTFSHSGDLKKHFRVHSGEKPFKCDICFREFSRSDSLKCHMKIHIR
ncbi:uncharacterized protein LOC142333895 isoform X1 [Lycorma delicatula]|uniref:uncharacterized protein LOC142333895 isoform X1 n=1 Tax=Lycorma delicatula TaxID=130591 RepID=UPI003F512671